MRFLIQLAIVNIIFMSLMVYFISENLPVPFNDKTLDNLQHMDVLSAQTSSEKNLSFELRNHDIPADCWIEYSGKYYDITTILYMDASLPEYCGRDATEIFDTQDKKSPLRTIEARRMLSQFQIQ